MNPAFSGSRGYTLVEPSVLLCFFGQVLADAATTSLLFIRSDEYYLKIKDITNVSIVDYVNNMLMYKSFVDTLVPALLMFFLGPWSDSYGRKPLLVAAYTGSAISFLLWGILSVLGPLNPWIFLVASMPAALVGGYCTVVLATHCYVTDIRQESDRAWHFTWLQSVMSVGQLSGYIVAYEMGNYYNFATVFGIASVANLFAVLYVLFFVPESVTQRDAKRSSCCLCNPSFIKDMFATCLRKREGSDRVLIWCCVCVLAINVLIAAGERIVLFELTFNSFRWFYQLYFGYTVAVMILIIAGMILGGLICKALIDQTMASMSIAVLAIASALAGSIVKSYATQSSHFFISPFIGILGGLLEPVVRNTLSKSVPPQHVGKVFSLTTSVEAVISLVSGRLYNMVYSKYTPTAYPLPVYLLSVGLYAFTILIVLTIKWRISQMSKLKDPPSSTPE